MKYKKKHQIEKQLRLRILHSQLITEHKQTIKLKPVTISVKKKSQIFFVRYCNLSYLTHCVSKETIWHYPFSLKYSHTMLEISLTIFKKFILFSDWLSYSIIRFRSYSMSSKYKKKRQLVTYPHVNLFLLLQQRTFFYSYTDLHLNFQFKVSWALEKNCNAHPLFINFFYSNFLNIVVHKRKI